MYDTTLSIVLNKIKFINLVDTGCYLTANLIYQLYKKMYDKLNCCKIDKNIKN